jgi:hypothetical protein
MNGKNRIMIYGPKDDGTYVNEFRTSEGDVLSISIPRSEGGHAFKDSLSISQRLTRCSPPAVAQSYTARLGAFASSPC